MGLGLRASACIATVMDQHIMYIPLSFPYIDNTGGGGQYHN